MQKLQHFMKHRKNTSKENEIVQNNIHGLSLLIIGKQKFYST